jgi:hypothetical protein
MQQRLSVVRKPWNRLDQFQAELLYPRRLDRAFRGRGSNSGVHALHKDRSLFALELFDKNIPEKPGIPQRSGPRKAGETCEAARKIADEVLAIWPQADNF